MGEQGNSRKTLAKDPAWEKAFVSKYSDEIEISK